jgi:beta-lactam-binding protein with PASTA domain
MSNVKLDSKGSATCQITVKNVSRAAIDGRAVLVSLPPATKTSPGVVENSWVKIDGLTDRHFAIDQEEVFSVKIAVPQKKEQPAPPGNYSFRMDVINTARPDDSGDQSPALGFTVAAVVPRPKPKWPLIAAIAAAVVIIGGLTVWLLTRGTPVPDVTGKSTTDAFTALAQVKLILDQNIEHVDSTPENSGKIVFQNPPAGSRASAGSIVTVKLGSPMVFMPDLINHNFADAQTISNQRGLGAVTSTTVANAKYGNGVVWDQTPSPGANVRTGTTVSLKVTPQLRTVPELRGMPLPVASQRLGEAGLSLGQVQGFPGHDPRFPADPRFPGYPGDPRFPGYRGFQGVTGQDPGPGAQVPVGTPVNIQFPCPPGFPCAQVFNRVMANQMVMDAVRAQAITK